MKKLFFFFPILALFACEQIYEDDLLPSLQSELLSSTRASSSLDFDPLDELRGIPVNIINVGNSKYKYLSAAESGDRISVYNRDDGSLRQRWIIYNLISNIVLAGGSKTYTNTNQYPSVTKENNKPVLRYTLGEKPLFDRLVFTSIPGTAYYYIGTTGGGTILRSGNGESYMQSKTSNGRDLTFASSKPDYAKWEIRPVGEYQIIDIQYIQSTSSVITREDQLFHSAIIDNTKNNTQVTYQHTIKGDYKEESSFSNTEGVSVSLTVSTQVGIPIVNETTSGNISVSTSQTSSKNWTFGTSESKTFTVQELVEIPIPPKTKTLVEGYKTSYNATVTYIATLRDINNHTFRVKGTWSGVTTTNSYYEITDLTNNQIIGTFSLPQEK